MEVGGYRSLLKEHLTQQERKTQSLIIMKKVL